MIRKRVLLGIVVSCLVLVLLLTSEEEKKTQVFAYQDDIEDTTFNYTFAETSVADLLKQQRDYLARELVDYVYPPNTNLDTFSMDAGGEPLRSIIITTWRSGSTFLGDVLNAVPGNFYHYEPLLDFGIVQVRGPPMAREAIRNLKSLLKCDYSKLGNYLEYGREHVYLFTHNTRLWHWNQCDVYPHFCWNSTFLTETCKNFPFQSMKVVRLRLHLAEKLLRDKELKNLKILLLVRDPRGTLQSRKHRNWCPGEPDCDQPGLLCSDMVSDYITSKRLMQSYPTRFRAIRYEDLSLDPYATVQDLFSFFGLYFHPQVSQFLDTHTKTDSGGVSSTFRNSKNAAFHWRQDLNFSEVQYIEENCDDALQLWGYNRVKNESQLRDFNPLGPFVMS